MKEELLQDRKITFLVFQPFLPHEEPFPAVRNIR